MDVTICVATFGDDEWIRLAERVALPSANRQGCPVIHHHDPVSLAEARNAAIAAATTEWVIVLDADDRMSDGYAEALATGHADIRSPALVEVMPDGATNPVPLRHRNIEHVNPVPVSAMARRADILAAGGFAPWPAWEDWALWLTLARRGATIEHIDAAVLYATVRPRSRNRSVTDPQALHAAIKAASR